MLARGDLGDLIGESFEISGGGIRPAEVLLDATLAELLSSSNWTSLSSKRLWERRRPDVIFGCAMPSPDASGLALVRPVLVLLQLGTD
mmetsp:Transcript_58637/g.104968  ORF Transcript_58637/g.104968 Transcript_58637/m.104968 type:complete len:88 (-) Transcript_58637:319-582(-)